MCKHVTLLFTFGSYDSVQVKRKHKEIKHRKKPNAKKAEQGPHFRTFLPPPPQTETPIPRPSPQQPSSPPLTDDDKVLQGNDG